MLKQQVNLLVPTILNFKGTLMYKEAIQLNLRFQTTKGNLLPQDLFFLPNDSINPHIVSINSIYKEISKAVQDASGNSLGSKTKIDPKQQLRLDILEDIYETNVVKAKTTVKAQEKAIYKEQLTEALAEKQIDEIKEKSSKAIQKELKNL